MSQDSFEMLPSGSPNTFRYHQINHDLNITPPRHSNETHFFGSFPFRVIKERPIAPPESVNDSQISQNNSKLNFFQSSDEDEEIQFPNFELSPMKPQNITDQHTLSTVSKNIAVQVLSKYSKTDPKVKYIFDNIFAMFFQSFDEWNHQIMKNKKKKEEDLPETIQNANIKIRNAEERLHKLENELNKWTNIKPKNIIANIPDIPPLEKNLSDFQTDLTEIENFIHELDTLQKKIQVEDGKCQEIAIFSTDISDMMKSQSEQPISINNLLE